jgi:hypothetical protein
MEAEKLSFGHHLDRARHRKLEKAISMVLALPYNAT